MKNLKAPKWLYYIFVFVLVIFAAYYMKGLETQRYNQTRLLSLDGMFPTDSHKTYQQQLIPAENELLGFSLQFYTRDTICKDQVHIQLIDEKDQRVIQSWDRGTEEFQSDMPEIFLLDEKLTGVSGKTYLLDMVVETGDSEKHVSVCTSLNDQPGGELFGTFTANDKIQEDQVLKMTLCTPKLGNRHIFMALAVLLLFCLVSIFVTKLAPEKVLLLVLAVIGTGYFIAIPMLQVPDESGHYYRSFEISQGDLLTPKSYVGDGLSTLPAGLIPEDMVSLKGIDYEMIRNNLDWEMAPRAKSIYSNPTQALYSPVSYLPQALGCLVGRLLTRRTVMVFYLARFFNFLACGLLCYYAVKWIPFGKRFLLLACCMPMYLQQMVSLSSDAFINAAAFFLLAQILKIMKNEGMAGKKERLLLGISCALVALCKVVYLPLCFMVLLIPAEKLWEGKKGKWYKIGLCVGSTVLNLGWMLIAFGYMIEFRAGVDSPAQVKYILTHPISYLLVVTRTCGDKLVDWLGTMVGAKMCVLNVYTSLLFVLLYLIVLGMEMIILDEKEENFLKTSHRVWSIVLFFLLFGITLTTLYVQWTALQSPMIEGFQGRYLIPLLPLLAMGLKKIRVPAKSELILKYQMGLVIATNICALYSIFTYY